jgi:hypothetical protein
LNHFTLPTQLAGHGTLHQLGSGSSPAQGIFEKEGSPGLASFPVNTLRVVAKPRLRDLQGKPRHAFGQVLGAAMVGIY